MPLKWTASYPELSEPYVPHPIRPTVLLSTAASARTGHLSDYFRR
jgi:hypothetical protein